MVLFPTNPVPSSVSAPAIIDEILRFQTDSSYEMRRSLHSRPRYRYTLDYLGMSTQQLRFMRDFIQVHRLGAMSVQFLHPTAFETLVAGNSTPVTLTYYHGLVSGAWVNIGFGPAGLLGAWPITRLDNTTIALNGSVASGAATVTVAHYLPNAVVRFNGDVWESPAKLIGPERLGGAGIRPGFFSFQLVVEEVF